ncbi:uncharacterized protein LOC116846993 isoform X1 [Odontomachus brunneus]|uniref:uncharacterized protein LOC116846993 isoform X1 n=1 Tax=Odontomachus brunneus TaxID=486640 RepID=UPI0013F21732|nr:uncharacterized protein LOC116846993 isoform X1 [Odontomachus brunneus]
MPAARATTVGRSFVGYLAALCIVSLTSGLAQVEGRKCACTSRACREMGVDVCSTKFSCYTEFILTAGQGADESTTTRGCTESATPLLCETKSWATRSRSVSNVEPSASPWVRVPWPRLKCCNSHDYCNAADGSDASTWTPERRKVMDPARSAVGLGTPENGVSTSRDTMPTIQQGVRQHEDSAELTGDRLLRNRVKALHVAALVLAVAALISVLASCYVVTRFLRSNRYTMNNVN